MQCAAAQSKVPEKSLAGQKSTHWKKDSPHFFRNRGLYHPLLLFQFWESKPPCARGFSASSHFTASFGISSAWAALANHHILHLVRGLAQHRDSLEYSPSSVSWPHVWALNTLLKWHRCPYVCMIGCRGQFINIFWQWCQARYSLMKLVLLICLEQGCLIKTKVIMTEGFCLMQIFLCWSIWFYKHDLFFYMIFLTDGNGSNKEFW